MKIECTCGATYEVPDAWIGKTAKCKQCSQSILIKKESPLEKIIEQREEIYSLGEIKQTIPQVELPQVQTIEMTSKKWKRIQLNGCLLSFVCFIFALIFIGFEIYTGALLGMLGMVLGVFVLCYARFGAWWYHG